MKSLLIKTYSFVFLNDFVLIYPLYAVMFTDHGLSTAQVAVIMAVWSGTVFLLEVPSGVLADKFSRRHLMAAGQVLRACGFLCWMLFPSFWGYLAGFLLWGTKSALTHGTLEAWLFDELKARGEAASYAQYYSWAVGLSFAGILLASLGASVAILQGYDFVLTLSIAAGLGGALVTLTFPESKRDGHEGDDRSYLKLLKLGLKNSVSDPVTLRIMIFVAFVCGLIGTLDEFWPIFADLAGTSNSGVAIFVGIMSGFQALASFQAWRADRLSNKAFYFSVIIAGGMLIWSGLSMSLFALGFLIVVSAINAVVKVIFDSRLQHRLDSETRATVFSVKGLLTEVFGLMGLATFGFVSAAYGTSAAFTTMGALIGLGGCWYWVQSTLRNRKEVKVPEKISLLGSDSPPDE